MPQLKLLGPLFSKGEFGSRDPFPSLEKRGRGDFLWITLCRK
jgi:hypothetical protein